MTVASAGLSGYSIGSGGVAIYEGRYADGALDIALGFMGTGVATSGYKLIKFTFGPVNAAIRQKYMYFVAKEMPQKVALWTKQGKTTEQIAHSLILMRNSIKLETRAMMAADGVAGQAVKKILELRNRWHYGHPLGPDLAWFANQGKSAKEIVESALRSNEAINRAIGGAL